MGVAVPKLRVHNFSVTVDGFAAGPNQRADAPFGDGMDGSHDWMFATKGANAMIGEDGGEEGIDNDFFLRGEVNVGATIMGRNMFGPIRGPWPNEDWKGWWGPNPPYHNEVFVLTHHERPALPMEGGTTFHFVNDSPEAVLERAFKAADGKDVRIGGGAATIRQFLRAGLIDELHVVITPIVVGSGARLFDDLGSLGGAYQVSEFVPSGTVTHVVITKR